MAKAGGRESILAYQEAHVPCVLGNLGGDANVMTDSTGPPDRGGTCLTRTDAREGRADPEARLAIVAQRSTAAQPCRQLVPGTADDSPGLRRVTGRCGALGIDVGSCLMDAGCRADASPDEFCDDGHRCVVPYVTRPEESLEWRAEALEDALDGLESRENLVRHGDRCLFVRRVDVMAGANRDQPACLHVGIDTSRLPDEPREPPERARRKRPGIDKACEGLENQGVFAPLSGTPYGTEEMLPEHCVRQGTERPNDVAKGHAKPLPARCHTAETLGGHALMFMVGNSLVRLTQIGMNDSETCLASRMEALRSRGCIPYKSKLVPDDPTSQANDVYGAFGIETPTSLPLRDGMLPREPQRTVPHLFAPPKKRKPKAKSKTKAKGEKKASAGATAKS